MPARDPISQDDFTLRSCVCVGRKFRREPLNLYLTASAKISSSAVPLSAMGTFDEKRHELRESIDIAGSAVAGDNGLLRFPMMVRNLSRAGAMIELSHDTDLPSHVVLLFRHRLEPCRTVWRAGTMAGVRFLPVAP